MPTVAASVEKKIKEAINARAVTGEFIDRIKYLQRTDINTFEEFIALLQDTQKIFTSPTLQRLLDYFEEESILREMNEVDQDLALEKKKAREIEEKIASLMARRQELKEQVDKKSTKVSAETTKTASGGAKRRAYFSSPTSTKRVRDSTVSLDEEMASASSKEVTDAEPKEGEKKFGVTRYTVKKVSEVAEFLDDTFTQHLIRTGKDLTSLQKKRLGQAFAGTLAKLAEVYDDSSLPADIPAILGLLNKHGELEDDQLDKSIWGVKGSIVEFKEAFLDWARENAPRRSGDSKSELAGRQEVEVEPNGGVEEAEGEPNAGKEEAECGRK